MRQTRAEKATAVVDGLFTVAPQNRTAAQKLAAKGQSGGYPPTPATQDENAAGPGRRAGNTTQGSHLVDGDNLPIMGLPWQRIQQSVFTLDDPDQVYAELADALRMTEALTPGNLMTALNDAENNARRAHQLYVVARVDFERFELEMGPVIDAMREAANKDLQAEKSKGERSKAITDADIRGRASVLFPDEWGLAQGRRAKAEGFMDTLKHFADLWKQRCFSLSTMLNAGKRS